MNYIQQLGQNAARAKKQIAGCPTGEKNRILTEIAAILRANASEILKANEQDIAQAKIAFDDGAYRWYCRCMP